MCGRFALVADLRDIQKIFDIHDISCEYRSGWNIAPGQLIPAVIRDGGVNKLVCFSWGLIPAWSKNRFMTDGLINARAETVDKKPSFQDAFRKRRCLIVADGFYEWKKEGGKKLPMYYYLKTGRPFCFAGLYDTWISPDKKEVKTCTIITTTANELIAPVHDRMPVILSPESVKIWMEKDGSDALKLKSVLRPYPSEEMDSRQGIGPHESGLNSGPD